MENWNRNLQSCWKIMTFISKEQYLLIYIYSVWKPRDILLLHGCVVELHKSTISLISIINCNAAVAFVLSAHFSKSWLNIVLFRCSSYKYYGSVQVKFNVQQGNTALSLHISCLPHNHAHFKLENKIMISEKLQLIKLN